MGDRRDGCVVCEVWVDKWDGWEVCEVWEDRWVEGWI
jgi:hypothetical protein